eukprot:NODE_1993_length_790_cov_596.356275_g1584_i0.p2 GENE.NODE_1993_length_790_cov_596.356275_g1584_i0~~NODE_1993_length_790_cov_596.356275_g1584_i0.p2  ORF type:complete len:115 (+),score=14.83 NODE_1993_length_790_cov_596.356275_g1584_i0:82-426(+)
MGIDRKVFTKKGGVRQTKCQDPYRRVLVKIYKFLYRRAKCAFVGVVAKRMMKSGKRRPPLSVGKICKFMAKRQNNKRIAVIVGDVTADMRRNLKTLPPMKVCALRFTRLGQEVN